MSDLVSVFQEIINEIELEKKVIKKLDKIYVPVSYKKLIYEEFIDEAKKIKRIYNNDLYKELIKLYHLYFSNLVLFDKYLNFEKFIFFPKEIATIAKLLKCHWYINLIIYNLGSKEKSYIEERLKNRFFSDIIKKINNLDEALYIEDERGKILYWSLLGSDILFKNLKEKTKDKLLRNHAFRVLLMDNVLEELWHVSGVITLDLAVYYKLLKTFNKNSVKDLFDHLERKTNNIKKLIYPIPKFFQHYNSCGVACLLNAAKVYYPKLELNKKLEKNLLEKVQYKDYPGNLAPLLVMVAKDVLKLEAKMFFDLNTYIKNFDAMKIYAKEVGFDEKRILEVANFFIEAAKKVGYIEKSEWYSEEIEKLLNEGSLILFAKDLGSILHYNLIFGYDSDKFHIFDPLYGTYSVSKNEINEIMKNRFGMWGVIVYPPYIDIIKEMENNVEECRRVLKNYGIEI
ncbi:MAG: hypothetical protein KQA34_03475 [Candidatus Aenigmarchaeota archaeon]|nr:hypothetical protein [Candidatus Aenigmarchaeota archaeon]